MLKIKVFEHDFSVCKITDVANVNFTSEFCFVGKTDEELSLVCLSDDLPSNCIVEDSGWRCFRIQGELDFGLVGILAKIASLLADNQIPIFAISTYNTDYILTKKENFQNAMDILAQNEYTII